MQQKRQQLGNLAGAILCLWLALVATVASVPTSVLAQNSELTSTTNSRSANNNGNNNGNSMMMMTKVKRSSSSAKDAALNGLAAASPASNDAAATGPDKKSSPEIVPASYNSPTPSQQARMSSAANAAGGSSNGGGGGGGFLLPSNGEIINSAIAAGLTAAAVEAAAAAASNQQRDWELKQQHQLYGGGGDDGQQDGDQEVPPTLLHKRGINAQQYLYGGEQGLGGGAYGGNGEYYNGNAYLGAVQAAAAPATVPAGVWADELDPSMVYTDLQELDDFVPAARATPSYRNKAYDNLQSLLNAEASYLEPMVMPLQYPQTNRYYGAGGNDERSKRTSLNKLSKYADMRLKRDTKLTPADMLALVALVEAGERARKDTDDDAGAYAYGPEPAPYGGGYLSNTGGGGFYDYPTAVDDVDYANGPAVGAGTWLEPAMVDYYGMPMNLETLPKYELAREHKYGGNRYPSKRFMVAKKKRSMGKFLNEPVSKPSYASLNGNAEKYF